MIISLSGMRGIVGSELTPELVASQAAALGAWALKQGNRKVVLGRDARTSGPMFAYAAQAGFMSVGAEVIDVGLVPTPTVQLAVEHHRAGAGLIITASHNPVEWNALKFVGPDGVFLGAAQGAEVQALVRDGIPRAGWDGVGRVTSDGDAVTRHLDMVLRLPVIAPDLIRDRKFKVALDCVRGAGGVIMPELLDRLGCEVTAINLETDGRFPRAPEPLPENLAELSRLVTESGADLGVAVDPDVDRLALVAETGEPIGEDYTLAFAVQAVLGGGGPENSGNGRPVVVANLSTSLVVEDAATSLGAEFHRAPVGEANVAQAIAERGAVIGGEGNGGVMYPGIHIGRDAPVGLALILQLLARSGASVSNLVGGAPRYTIVKAKLPRGEGGLDEVYRRLADRFTDATGDDRDGLRLAWQDRWLHLRPSGTEPIIRIIAEAPTREAAEQLVDQCRELFR